MLGLLNLDKLINVNIFKSIFSRKFIFENNTYFMLLCSVILWVGILMLKYTGVSILVYELHLIKCICYWITHCLKINVYKSWNAYLWRCSLPVYARWSKMWFRSTLKDEKSNNLTGVRYLQKQNFMKNFRKLTVV